MFFAVAAVALLAGCATTPPAPAGARIVVSPSRQLKITNVQAERRPSSILVTGRVGRRPATRTSVWGHLHVEAWGERGLLKCADTRWTLLRKSRLPTSWFRTKLEVAPEDVNEIRISHVPAAERREHQSGICA
ncbi:hypothetical protein E2493_02790 [Sphingomonas parva]|uniref:DUF1425 domain-containing protein n=1 Tax=Sphingomonas parva TaxID=2555898 RepID=A0A4Y8ZWP1_9SPHN|nr:hypothetical protein [Sphingomonas parva]TFI59782.1 hypothetical protein E2493_02790 [Sphingomonas parva]